MLKKNLPTKKIFKLFVELSGSSTKSCNLTLFKKFKRMQVRPGPKARRRLGMVMDPLGPRGDAPGVARGQDLSRGFCGQEWAGGASGLRWSV